MKVAGNHTATFIAFPPRFEIDNVSFDWIASSQLRECWARSFFEGIEAPHAVNGI
jgi:hypothetical protein